MPHILLVSYGFAPANNMSAHRLFLRAKSFDRHGWTVSVVTRVWNSGPADAPSQLLASSGPIVVEKLFERTTVFRLPFGADSLVGLNRAQRFFLGQRKKARTKEELRILDTVGFFLMPIEYAERLSVDFDELAGLLDGRPDYVLATGNPWSDFEIGRELATRFKAKYIAEYRDPWGYIESRFRIRGFNDYKDNPVSQLKRRYALMVERRINRRADLVIAASQPFLDNALQVLGAKGGHVALNGYDREEFDAAPVERYAKFTMTYVGTIYSQQRTEIFFRALQTFIDRNGIDPHEIAVRFLGSKYCHGFEITEKKMRMCRHFETVVDLAERAGKMASLTAQKSSDVLLFFAHEKSEGIYPGKIFEYIAADRPILLSPSDHGVLEELITRTRTGAVCDTEEDVVVFLEGAYRRWKSGAGTGHAPDRAQVELYSYDRQAVSLMQAIGAL